MEAALGRRFDICLDLGGAEGATCAGGRLDSRPIFLLEHFPFKDPLTTILPCCR
jgi:hypothetical protein